MTLTFQIDVAVNAPQAGVLKELLAKEEDTVVVDQEIAKIDASAAKPEGSDKPESKEPPKKEEASTDARPTPADAENKPGPKSESKPASESAKPSPAPQPKQQAKEAPATTGPVLGSREERRVRADLGDISMS